MDFASNELTTRENYFSVGAFIRKAAKIKKGRQEEIRDRRNAHHEGAPTGFIVRNAIESVNSQAFASDAPDGAVINGNRGLDHEIHAA